MSCPDENDLVEMIEHALDPVALRDLEVHLDSCEQCRGVVAALAVGSQATPPIATPGTPKPAWATVDHPELLDEETINGRYVIDKVLGRGGMATVYLARDTTLGRDVALKLHRAGAGNERLHREAVAMAKLSHPNVVNVFDVGTVGDRTYVALEYVQGETLRGWLKVAPRTWREVLAMLLEAGTGLAAAHAAGLIHRDFKPDNVLVGADGRARVSDFGLAHLDGRTRVPAGSLLLAEGTPLTETGTVLGTPAYMAPEQAAGGAVDARCDQFAFCLVAWESLFGQRAFAGATLAMLQIAIEAGELQRPKQTKVPAELIRVLERGLAVDPAARFADMSELLAALRRAGRSRLVRRVALVAAAALVLGAGGIAIAAEVGERRHAAACEAEGAQVRALLGAQQRTAIQKAFVASGSPLAPSTFERTSAVLDRATDALAAQITLTCRGRDEPARLATARRACLAGRKARLAQLMTSFSKADAKLVQRAADAAWAAFDARPCDDVTALATRPMASPHAEQLGRVKALIDAGQYPQATSAALALLEQAKATPLELDVVLALGQARHHSDVMTAISDFHRALALAEAQGRDFEAAIALETLANLSGVDKHDYVTAHRFVELARAKLQRLGGQNLAIHGKLLTTEGQILLDENRLGEAEIAMRKAVAVFEEVHGADHPNVGLASGTLSHVLRFQEKHDAALVTIERTVRILEAAFGPDHPKVAGAYMTLAQSWTDAGKLDEAHAALVRADAVFARVFGDVHRNRVAALANLGGVELRRKNFAAAHEKFLVAREIIIKLEGPGGRSISGVQLDIGRALIGLGKLDDAVTEFERAVGVLEGLGADGEPWLGGALFDLAGLHLQRGRADLALPIAERSLALVTKRPDDANAFDVAEAKFTVAAALWDTGGDKARAQKLAEEARAHPAAERKAEIETWIAEHAARTR